MRIAREAAGGLERRAQRRVRLAEGAGDAVADRAGLAGHAAALGGRDDVVLALDAGDLERLERVDARGLVGDVLLEGALVDRALAFAGDELDAGDGGLAAAGGLCDDVCHGGVFFLC